MSNTIIELLPDYVASRLNIVRQIGELRAELEMIHHKLRLSFMEQKLNYSEWLYVEIDKYIASDDSTRRDFLSTLIELMQYDTPKTVAADHLRVEAKQGARREGQIRLDLTTWVSMRNSISFAIDSMLKYTQDTAIDGMDDIRREARSYEKNRVKPIDYIEDLAAPDSGELGNLLDGLENAGGADLPSIEGDVTVSILDFSRRQQQIMQMLTVEGKSYSEIAEELGISKDSVAEHVSQARKRAQHLKDRQGIQQAFRDVLMEADIAARSMVTVHSGVKVSKEKERVGEQMTIDDLMN